MSSVVRVLVVQHNLREVYYPDPFDFSPPDELMKFSGEKMVKDDLSLLVEQDDWWCHVKQNRNWVICEFG